MNRSSRALKGLRRAEAEAKQVADRALKTFRDARLDYDLAYANWLSASNALVDALVQAETEKHKP